MDFDFGFNFFSYLVELSRFMSGTADPVSASAVANSPIVGRS